MKTKTILIAMTLVIFTSLNSFAVAKSENGKNDPDPTKTHINIRVNQDNLVVLRAVSCDDQKKVNFVIRVYSDKGEMVYTASVHRKNGFYKAFDMQNLPEGKYSFEIYKNLKKVYAKEVVKYSELASEEVVTKKMVVQEL